MLDKAVKQWPADKVERWPVDKLRPYPRNPRQHSSEQIDQIAASMREFGWTMPCLVDEAGEMIAGHGRIEAAIRLGLTDVPVMIARGWTDAQKSAYRIADNQLALSSTWDDDLLKLEVGDLQVADFDLSLLGFDASELGGILDMRPEGLTDPDDAPEAPANPVSIMGDLWMLGRQRLLCGDSTVADDVAKVLGGVKPHLMVTDPPYGVGYDANWRNERVRTDGTPIAGRAIGKVANDHEADWSKAWALFPGDVAYVWHADLRARQAIESLEACNFKMRAQIIWSKGRFAIGRGDYHFQHEPCWYAVRKNKTGHWTGDRKQTTVWEISHSKSETGHSTQKPVECMKRPIENNSSPGQAVYEPFSGSGTTIIAAEMTGRCCYAIEISPVYVDVAIQRWQNFTGQKATLDGKTFDEVKACRTIG